jgi:hypothetical protein
MHIQPNNMDLNYIMETLLKIVMINIIGIIIITFTIGFNMLCELMIKKYMRRKLMNKTTQTDNRKYSEDDLENTYDVYNDASYQYTKKLKTRSRC